MPGDAIDPVYYDASYYMAPDGDAGQDVYVVLRDAIAKTGRVALSRVVIDRRERGGGDHAAGATGWWCTRCMRPRTSTIPEGLVRFHPVRSKPAQRTLLALATQLIDRQTAKFDLSDMEDRYEARLREVIAAKLKGKGVKPVAVPKDDGKVIDLMAALKRSLGQTADKPAVKKLAAPAKKPVRKRA